ncbi:MAG: ABC transporter substrate-binding protein [Candidatus Thiodiazotropha sp.]
MQRGWTVLLLTTLLTVACADPQSSEIRMGLATAPLNLDPRYATDATSERINRLLYQRLVEFDPQGRPIPGVAEWRRLSPRHYRFTMTESAGEFTPGERLGVADVLATYAFVLDPANASPQRDAISLIEGLQQVDGDSFDIFLKRTDPLLPAYLTLNLLPAKLIAAGHSFSSRPVGSGPFRLLDGAALTRLLLERRRDGQRFRLLEVKNPTVRALKLLRGEIDLLQNDLSPELLDYLRERAEGEGLRTAGSNFTYLGFNLQDPALSDQRVRQAIAHAIDRRGIIERVMRGAAREAETLFPPEHWAGHPGLTSYGYDPALSRRLLRAAGYGPENPLRLVYKSSSDPFRIRLATIIQSQLAAAGIEVTLRSYDWGTFFGDIKAGNFQLYSLSWVGLRTPDSFRYIFASDALPPQGANRGRYASERVDRLLQLAEQATTPQLQAQYYRQIEERLHADLPYVPLWFEDQYAIQGDRVSGYTLSSDGNYDGLREMRLMEPQYAEKVSAH